MVDSWKRTGVAPEGFAIVLPDGGWGWIVLLGCSMNAACYMIVLYVFYLTMNDIKEEFQIDTITVTLPMTLFGFTGGITAPIASMMTTFSSSRKCMLLGGILLSVTLILSSFVSNIWQMAAVFAVLGGFGSICVYIPVTSILAEFFKDNFGVAVSIYFSAYSIVKMTVPLFIEYLLREYSWRECMFILGALTLNSCVGSLTFQPSRWHLQLKPLATNQMYIMVNTTDDQKDTPSQNNVSCHLPDNETDCWKLRRYLDIDLLKNPMFYLTSISYILIMIVVFLSSRFLYVYAVEVGLKPVEAAWLLSANAFGEIFGRLTAPMLLKLFNWPIQPAFIVYTAVAAVLYVVFSFMTSPWGLFVLTASSDFFFNSALILVPSIMLQFLGAAKLVHVVGYSEFLLGVMMLAFGSFAGWLHDVTGTYVSCYFLFAFLIAFITFMWSLRLALYKLRFITNTSCEASARSTPSCDSLEKENS